jgi:hypothetical protein
MAKYFNIVALIEADINEKDPTRNDRYLQAERPIMRMLCTGKSRRLSLEGPHAVSALLSWRARLNIHVLADAVVSFRRHRHLAGLAAFALPAKPRYHIRPDADGFRVMVAQDEQVGIAAKLRSAVEHARLAAHQQGTDPVAGHRRKDFPYPARDQANLRSADNAPIARRWRASAARE